MKEEKKWIPGRKKKYGEETKVVRVPVSLVDVVHNFICRELEKKKEVPK